MFSTMKTRTMQPLRAVLPAAVGLGLLLAACTYDAPLETNHAIPIEPAVLGVWQATDDESEGAPARMVVLPFSPTEYLIHYPTAADDSMYFRGYAIEIAGIPCVQLELLGSHKGRETGKERHQVARYSLTGDRLEIRTLNADIVSSGLSGSAALREAFEKNASSPDLFQSPGVFVRVGR